MQDKLDFLISHISAPQKPEACTQPEIQNPPTPPWRGGHSPPPALPSEFDRDRTKGMAFLYSCQTYFRLCPNSFSDDQAKIMWALSYMKIGRAAKWAARVFQWEEQEGNQGLSRFLDWEDFRTEFRKEFCPSYTNTAAINRLKSTAYFQRSRSVDDYLDEFQDLITEAGYSDPKMVVVKFRRVLDPQIQNAIATMASGRPSDLVPIQWYGAARTIDLHWATNKAFRSSYRAPTPGPSQLHPVAQSPPSMFNALISAVV